MKHPSSYNGASSASLTQRVAIGAAWLVAGRWGVRLIGMLSTLSLARLLTPEDFGIVAVAGLVVAILDALTDFRFGQALVRFQNASESEFDTAWTLNVIRGLIVATILVAGADLFAKAFGDTRLIPVFRLLGVVALIDGFQNIGTITFTKDIRFDLDLRLLLAQKVTTVVVTVLLALMWRTYWAILTGMVVGSAFRLVLSYTMHQYRPWFNISATKRLWGFSGWLMASQLITLLNQRLEQFIIGGVLSPSFLGIYNVAYELASMVTGEIVAPLTQVLFPAYSQIGDDKQRLREAYEKSLQLIVAIGTPLGVGFAFVAPEFILLVLGPKWEAAIFPARVLCIMFSIAVIAMASTSLLPALGRTRDVFRLNALTFIARLPVTSVAMWQFGFDGAVYSRFAFGVLWTFQYMIAVRAALGISLTRVLHITWRSYAAVFVMALVLFGIDRLAALSSRTILSNGSVLALLAEMLLKCLIGATAYIVAHLLFWQVQGRRDGPERFLIATVSASVLRASRRKR